MEALLEDSHRSARALATILHAKSRQIGKPSTAAAQVPGGADERPLLASTRRAQTVRRRLQGAAGLLQLVLSKPGEFLSDTVHGLPDVDMDVPRGDILRALRRLARVIQQALLGVGNEDG